MREGSLLLYPSGWLWLDHAALVYVAVGSAGRHQPEEVADNQLPRRQRKLLTTLRLGLWTFTVGHDALDRMLSGFATVSPEGSETQYSNLLAAVQAAGSP
jgi:hypothetical protein